MASWKFSFLGEIWISFFVTFFCTSFVPTYPGTNCTRYNCTMVPYLPSYKLYRVHCTQVQLYQVSWYNLYHTPGCLILVQIVPGIPVRGCLVPVQYLNRTFAGTCTIVPRHPVQIVPGSRVLPHMLTVVGTYFGYAYAYPYGRGPDFAPILYAFYLVPGTIRQ